MISVFCLAFCFGGAAAHISLRYPHARKYDLDFLDSFRTSGDCGMNPGSEVTQFQIGEQINLTWHLGYPHGGGYKIQLIRDGVVESLVPGGGQDWEDTGRSTQNHLVTLPSQPCQNCTIRLLRQATEWGKSYQFRSCSDIQLVQPGAVTDPCGTNGKQASNGVCECDDLYSGDRCQYFSLCQTDEHCNGPKGQGSCELINNSIFEEKMCLCNEGFFGEQCEKTNSFGDSARSWDENQFTEVDFGEHRLLWRVEGGEVEVIMEAATSSWVGLGWRPRDSDKSCRLFPTDAPPPRGNDFHAMDCTDVVVGLARGAKGAVADYYTRDRSTPRRDSLWGGEDDLVSGSVWEENGKTFMRFKKKVDGGTADHPFKGKLHMIWATGQEDDFYKADQLKYHGRKNRGIAVIDVVVEDSGDGAMDPVIIGLILALILLAILLLVQTFDNIDRSWGVCGACNPNRRNKFYPNSS